MNATTLTGLSMKYKHFREIEPSNKTDFIMLYFAACRSLHELENAIRRTNNGNNLPADVVAPPHPAQIIPNGSNVEKHRNIKIILFNKLFFHKFF